MKSRWKLREPYFRGADTYKFAFDGKETTGIDLIVDELGYFELDAPAPAGFYAFAKVAS